MIESCRVKVITGITPLALQKNARDECVLLGLFSVPKFLNGIKKKQKSWPQMLNRDVPSPVLFPQDTIGVS